MHAIKFVAALTALSLMTVPVVAQDWPSRPVTMVVPTTPGGAPDLLGRVVASRLSQLLGQPVVVENIAGAGGMIGAARVAKAPPDGYQFLIGTLGTQAQNQTLYKSPLYNAATDFTPVALLWQVRFILMTRKDLPADNLQEFIAYVKAHQPAMHYGSGGIGSPSHLACALFNAAVGINVTHVPYRGVGPVIRDLIGGRIDYLCPSATAAAGYIESKQVKAIALLSKDRSPLTPTYPSAGEQGLADFEDTGWSGMFLPKNTAPPITHKLNAAATAALETPAVQARFKQVGAEIVAPDRRSPQYLQKFVESEIRKWAIVIKAADIAIQ
ncbi:MAG TPA: tripartite tricarboxylate transporter substrate-binding protein [Terracidiphilus sp.]|jgi:tripartite-type tricarboxylate transporter receptor subunit TctC